MVQASRTFRIFVSSTFSDLKAERNVLQEHVFPHLRKLCEKRGTRFQAIDLRWGVSEEAGLDQQTMNICLSEIERCRQTSPRPNFIILLGDRYGWRPLPTAIPADEFDLLLHAIPEAAQTLLKQWYWRDDNAVPPEYVLQPRAHDSRYADYVIWEKEVERPLHQALESAAREVGLSEQALVKYTLSATGQEIVSGAFDAPDAPGHVFGFFRSIANLPEVVRNLPNDSTRAEGTPRAPEFIDTQPGDLAWDEPAHEALEDLRNQVQARLGDHVHSYPATWTGSGITVDHLPKLCLEVWHALRRIILAEISRLEEVDAEEREIGAHAEFGQERAKFFTGRTRMLQAIEEYLKGSNAHPLALWGASGSGKSALMAKAVQEARAAHPNAEIVFRFIGATPESSNVVSLLRSLCHQIYRRFGYEAIQRERLAQVQEPDTEKAREARGRIEAEYDIPSDIQGLSQRLSEFILKIPSDKPLILFLDALDQLSEADNARSLFWLPTELPPQVRLIVSTLPGECLEALEGRLPANARLQLEPLSTPEGEELLDQWLAAVKRRLTAEQRRDILNKFERCQGSPLYLKLSFEEARHWHSSDGVPMRAGGRRGLAGDAPGVMRDLLARLEYESNHGQVLVSRALGYLAASKNGLTEDEMLDVLWQDEAVRKNFIQRSPKSPQDIRALPVVVWSRLYLDLEPYLTERSADGTSLLAFYHRQMAEAVQSAYCSGAEQTARHQLLARYFGDTPTWMDKEKRIPNQRKSSELPFQQAHGGMSQALEATLSTFDFLHAKLIASGAEDMSADYSLPHAQAKKGLRLIGDALRLSSHMLTRDADQLAPQMFGRMLGSKEPETQRLLQQAKHWTEQPWIRPLHRCFTSPGGALVRTLVGPGRVVAAVAVTPDGRRAISGSSNNALNVWDLESGKVERMLTGHTGAITCVVVTTDGKRAVSGSRDNTLKVWDLESGRAAHTLVGHAGPVRCVAVTANGKQAISGSEDKTLKVWNLETGQEAYPLTGHTDTVWSVAVTANGRWAISGSEDMTVRVWDLGSRCFKGVLGTGRRVVGPVAVTPDGKRALTGCAKTLRVWDLETGHEEPELSGHRDRVVSVAITADGSRAISGSLDKTLKIWNLETGHEERTLVGHTGGTMWVATTPDGKRVVSASAGTLKIWHLESERKELTLAGHTDGIWCVALTPDGKRAVSGSLDSTLMVWDLDSGRTEHRLTGHEDEVWCVAITPDGRRAVSASLDSTLRVWNLETGRLERILSRRAHWVWCVAITPDGKRAVSGSLDGTLAVWSLETGRLEYRLIGHKDAVECVAVTPDGKRAVSGSADKTLKVWDLETGHEEHTLEGHNDSVRCLALAQDGKRVVSGSLDSTVKVWNLATRQHEFTLSSLFSHKGGVSCLAVTPDGKRVISATFDNTLKLWNLENPNEREGLTLDGHTVRVRALAVTPDGKRVVSGSLDKTLRVWNLETGEEERTLAGHTGGVWCVAITTDGKQAISGSEDNTLKVWSLQRREEEEHASSRHKADVSCVGVTPDGKRAISGSEDKTLKIWNLETGQDERTIPTNDYGVRCVTVTPDGKRAISGSVYILKVWDLETGREEHILSRHDGVVTSVAVTPDGEWAVSCSGPTDNTVKIWNLHAGKEKWTLAGHKDGVCCIAVKPDGRQAISGSEDKTLKIWNLETGHEEHALEGHTGGVLCVALTPDGKQAVSGSFDRTLKIWNLDSDQEEHTLTGHTDRVLFVAVTPNGKRAVSGSEDQTLRVWNLDSGQEERTLVGHTGGVLCLALTPDGKRAVSGSMDRTLKVWNLETGQCLATFHNDVAVSVCSVAPDGQTIAAGDYAGGVFLLKMENVEPCAPIVTAWRAKVMQTKQMPGTYPPTSHLSPRTGATSAPEHAISGSIAFGCPNCRTWSEVSETELGSELRCPHCSTLIKLNPFTTEGNWRAIAQAWTGQLVAPTKGADESRRQRPMELAGLQMRERLVRPEPRSGLVPPTRSFTASSPLYPKPTLTSKLTTAAIILTIAGLTVVGVAVSLWLPWAWVCGIPIVAAGSLYLLVLARTVAPFALGVATHTRCPKCGQSAVLWRYKRIICRKCGQWNLSARTAL